jgi:hypothetical protein
MSTKKQLIFLLTFGFPKLFLFSVFTLLFSSFYLLSYFNLIDFFALSFKYSLFSGFSALFLFQFHPYYLLTIFGVLGVFILFFLTNFLIILNDLNLYFKNKEPAYLDKDSYEAMLFLKKIVPKIALFFLLANW